MVTGNGEHEYVRPALAAGAEGLIAKDRIDEELLPFLHSLVPQLASTP